MKTVLVTDGVGVVPRRARMTHRAAARLRARALDDELIAGTAPDGRLTLSLRAQALVDLRRRRQLAQALRTLVALAENPGPSRGLSAPVAAGTVLACAEDLEELADRLDACGPVAPAGVALVRRLLTDGTGPVYGRTAQRCADDLARAVAGARDALHPADLIHDRR